MQIILIKGLGMAGGSILDPDTVLDVDQTRATELIKAGVAAPYIPEKTEKTKGKSVGPSEVKAIVPAEVKTAKVEEQDVTQGKDSGSIADNNGGHERLSKGKRKH